jgi:pre-mRNA-processing factor 6
MMKKNPSVAF